MCGNVRAAGQWGPGHNKTALRMPEMLFRVIEMVCDWGAILWVSVCGDPFLKIGWIFGSCPCYDRGFVDQTWRPEFRRHCPMIVDLSLVWIYRSGRSGKIDSKFRHEKS